VPGGGPMTIAVLLRNTLVAAYRHAGIALAPDAI
jgi:methylenetetrahydrofolate dehydrogenase (NADP+)/methenyltetrahydrofolate cyclohydrolase